MRASPPTADSLRDALYTSRSHGLEGAELLHETAKGPARIDVGRVLRKDREDKLFRGFNTPSVLERAVVAPQFVNYLLGANRLEY